MKFIKNLLVWLGIMSLWFTSAFALEMPVNISATNTSESSITLSWDNVNDSAGYHIYFSEQPWIEILTAEKREFVTDIPLNIDGLNSNTPYYFIINAYDEIWEDGPFSDEVSFTTLWTNNENVEMNSAVEFKVAGIEVLAQNQVALSFTSNLENTVDAERIFKVVEKNDELIEYVVKDSKIDEQAGNKVIITFDEILPTEVEFKLVVISILDNQGRNIESGIESFENFIIEAEKLNYVYQEESGGIVIINDDNTTTTVVESSQSTDSWSTDSGFNDLSTSGWENKNQSSSDDQNNQESWNQGSNDQSTTQEESQWDTKNIDGQSDDVNNTVDQQGEIQEAKDKSTSIIGWDNLSWEDVAIDLLSAGQEAETLPTTWPEHIFMLILALVFGAMSFVFKYKKS